MNIKATYERRTGFRDVSPSIQVVTILGFVYGTYSPGYTTNNKTAVIAIVADANGKLKEVELCDLTVELNG